MVFPLPDREQIGFQCNPAITHQLLPQSWLCSGFMQTPLRLLSADTRDFVLEPVLHLVRGKNNRVDLHSTGSPLEDGGKVLNQCVNVSGLKQQFPNSLCSGTIDMTAGVLWGLLQSCSSVDLPWDVWGSAGMALTGQSVCATTCARGGHCHLRNKSGKEASLSFCVLQPAFGLSVLTYSKSP